MFCKRCFFFATLLLTLATVVCHADETVEISKNSSFCKHDQRYLICNITQKTVRLGPNSVESFERVQIRNANHVEIWPHICVNITLENVKRSSLIQESFFEGHGSNNCENMKVVIYNSHNISVPLNVMHLSVENSTLNSLKLPRWNGSLVSLNTNFTSLEVDEPIVHQHLSFINTFIKHLVKLHLASRSSIDFRNSRVEKYEANSLVLSTNSSILIQGGFIRSLETAIVSIESGSSVTINGYSGSIGIKSQEITSNETSNIKDTPIKLHNCECEKEENFPSNKYVIISYIALFLLLPGNIYLLVNFLLKLCRKSEDENVPANNKQDQRQLLKKSENLPFDNLQKVKNTNLNQPCTKTVHSSEEKTQLTNIKSTKCPEPSNRHQEQLRSHSEIGETSNILTNIKKINTESDSITIYMETYLKNDLLPKSHIINVYSEPSASQDIVQINMEASTSQDVIHLNMDVPSSYHTDERIFPKNIMKTR